MILYRGGWADDMQRHVLQHRQTRLLAQWDDIKDGEAG